MSQSLDGALRELRRGVSVVPDSASDAARRERIVDRMLTLQRELVSRDRARRRYAAGLLAAAAAVVLGVALLSTEPNELASVVMAPDRVRVNVVAGRLSVYDGDSTTSIGGGEVDVPRDAVVGTEQEAAALRLASRSAVELSPASKLRLFARPSAVGGRQERVRLLEGRVDLDVPKLGDSDELAVETADAVVEVRGTRFSVSLVPRERLAPFTQVDVSEGRVQIRHRDGVREVTAGQSWRSNADSVAPAPAASAPDVAAAPAVTAEPEPRVKARTEAPRSEAAASDLAAQNLLLDAAELAKESKMPDLALERLERLLERYPGAELAHNARVERFRLLAEMGRRDAARAAARDYLERHPRGFARSEAQQLLAPGPDTPQ